MSDTVELEMDVFGEPNSSITIIISRELYLIPEISGTLWEFHKDDNDAYPLNDHDKKNSLKTIAKLFGNVKQNSNGVYDFTKCIRASSVHEERLLTLIYNDKQEQALMGPPMSGFPVFESKTFVS